MPLKPAKLSDEDDQKFSGLLRAAYDDYKAARLLFNNDLLHPACIMANTCIEKELKARLMLLGIKSKFSHNSEKLLDKLQESDPTMALKIDKGFLKLFN
ncbi:HEPN domain-containing protein [Hymenobacter sp. GOD-10R]|uniref:HEPN domain-containing protein n=1 Tax=Hymenobacter sp. GOD-10R TaxID=3093922 RepID=UPI002D791FDE|nr:HEPN domain-containing protein [Hymenobacter sp. GOD-10R]WRQ31718.1 HEPN domain-containing protein [Hymenobacter sp. GOD-10R]